MNQGLDIKTRRLERFLKPQSIAVFGGGWAENVIRQLLKSGYDGDIWPVNPERSQLCRIDCYSTIDDLPGSPDAAFIGVNRHASIAITAALQEKKCGGAICFASGFKELQNHDSDTSEDLQSRLVDAAGAMPVLGPNCYGYLNYLDNVCLWPDQHGGVPVSSGVAIIAQSSDIAINMTMQRRGLELAHMLTVGNQAVVGVSELAMTVLSDPRVTAIGFYLEGFGDIPAFEKMALYAAKLGKPLVAIKVGRSHKARLASLTHTASLAGSSAASSALLERLAIVEVNSIEVMLETLKIFNQFGALPNARLASMSCSGGEASLMSDLALNSCIEYPDLDVDQVSELTSILGDRVDLANPLDYHTYIWGDIPAMTACFAAVLKGRVALTVLVLDVPRADRCNPAGHDCAIAAIIAAKKKSEANVAVVSVLSENLEESVSKRLIDAGIVPLNGMSCAISAIDAAMRSGQLLSKLSSYLPVALVDRSKSTVKSHCLNEDAAKTLLRKAGLTCPESQTFATKSDLQNFSNKLNYPLALKGLGIHHKTESQAVMLGIGSSADLSHAVSQIADCPDGYLLEQMVDDVVAELLIGVTRDDAGLMLLTLATGGVLAEILEDSACLCLPATRSQFQQAIESLRLAKILNGYRGKPAANIEALLDAIQAVERFALDHRNSLIELDINPLMVGVEKSVAVDALVRLY